MAPTHDSSDALCGTVLYLRSGYRDHKYRIRGSRHSVCLTQCEGQRHIRCHARDGAMGSPSHVGKPTRDDDPHVHTWADGTPHHALILYAPWRYSPLYPQTVRHAIPCHIGQTLPQRILHLLPMPDAVLAGFHFNTFFYFAH